MNAVSEEQARMILNPIISERDDDIFSTTRQLSRAVTEICDGKLQRVSAVQFSLLEVIDRLSPATRAAIARTRNWISRR